MYWKNTIGKIPSLIAQKLKICDPQLFTGHCFRRSGATILSDSGASKLTLKRAGRQVSDSVCDGYIAESSKSKLNVTTLIGQASEKDEEMTRSENTLHETPKINGLPTVTNNTFNDCNGFVLYFQ